MGTGTSILGAITAWLPQLEAAVRIGASLIAIIAGIYAILNYAADLKHKKQTYEKNKNNTRTGCADNPPAGLHNDKNH